MGSTRDVTEEHDVSIWLGDLNYRWDTCRVPLPHHLTAEHLLLPAESRGTGAWWIWQLQRACLRC